MRIFITGGAGYIGGMLADIFLQNPQVKKVIVLDLKGIECDAKIAKISEDQLREILEEVRRLRRKKKKTYIDSTDININEQDKDIENDEGESPYIR